MATENTNNETSFLEEDAGSSINVRDILMLILRNLHWFILCALICGGYSYYKVRMEERVYSSSATILIKTGSSGGSESVRSSAMMTQITGMGVAISSIDNEIIILKSAKLMERVVRDLELNKDYLYKTKVARRNSVLYDNSPIAVSFPELGEDTYVAFTATPIDDTYVVLSDFGENYPEQTVKVGETVTTPYGPMVISGKWNIANFKDVPILVRVYPVSAVANRYRSRLNVARDDVKNTILKLSIADNSPTRAADILNQLIVVYNDDAIEDQQKILDYSAEFINERIANLDMSLDSIQEKMVNFKRSNQVLDVHSLGQAEMATKSAMSAEVKALEAKSSRLKYVLNTVEELTDDQLIPAVSGLTPEAASLIKQYNENVSLLQSSSASANPTVVKVRKAQPDLKNSIINILETDMLSLDGQIRAAYAEKSAATAVIQSVPEQQVIIGSVERMQKIKEQLYLNLLTKREELLLNRPQLEANAKVVDAAHANYSPISPNEKKKVTSGILVGVAIPAAIILLIRLLDTAIHTRADVEKKTKTPFLGEIPYKEETPEHSLVIKENSRDAVSEAFRLVRSNLEYMRINNKNKQQGQVILFTSFMVSSGKTFVSSNLAYSFAFGNKKVALVDLDIRKGTLNKVFGLKSTHQGVSTYLSGKCDDIEEIIMHETGNNNLDAIMSGPIPPNPAELLMSDRLDKLVDYLRERYDYVFLDNVPLGMVADADIVKRVADNTLFVLCAGKTDKRYLNDLDKLYRNSTFPNLSIILNSVKYKKRRGYGYGYGYGYGKGYGYGYGYGGYGYGYGYGIEEEKKSRHFRRKHKSSGEKSEDKD